MSRRDGAIVAWHDYLFSVAVCGPKGQDNLAQGLPGLPWVNSPTEWALKRPLPCGEDWPRLKPCAFPTPGAPSGLNTFLWVTLGKPWLSYLGPSGRRITGATHVLARSAMDSATPKEPSHSVRCDSRRSSARSVPLREENDRASNKVPIFLSSVPSVRHLSPFPGSGDVLQT
jgi:hypothetical protein